MRIAFTSDLHADSSDLNRAAIPEIVRRATALEPDALVIAGDVSDDLDDLAETLAAFQEVAPVRVFVPGNHDVWLRPHIELSPEVDSTTRYDTLIAECVDRAGFHATWKAPCIVGDTAFVASIGWYDYAFAPEYMNLTHEDCRQKRFMGFTWQDLRFARWRARGAEASEEPLSDVEVTAMLNEDLAAQLDAARNAPGVRRIVVVTHHLPFREMVRYTREPKWDFFSAFMGSADTGALIEAYDAVTHVLAGHTHLPIDVRRNGVRCLTSPLGYLARKRSRLETEVARAVTLIDLEDDAPI